MKLFTKALAVPTLVGMLGLSTASQAMVVSEGFELGAGNFDSGEITLAAGDYSLDLEAFTFGPAGPFIFGIANETEAFQVSVAEFGLASTLFTTVGGVFSFLVGGNAGAGTVYEASINAIPLPPSILMLGTAAAAMFSFGRRHSKSAKKA